MKQGKVWLVGAGPGDAGLLTVKAEMVLREAEVVVYDALVGKAIIAGLSQEKELVYVGKRAKHHSMSQKEINRILIAAAGEGKRVVRLKGGDPFLFGRGGEELEALKEAGVPCEVIPGISSALAVPAYNGIPVTHRDYGSSLHIITGHRREGEPLEIDFAALCRMKGTFVFLMGVSALEEICRGFLEAGMAPGTPAAVLFQGTTAGQQRVAGTLEDISEQVRQLRLQPPAVIVVGEVCRLAERLSWYEQLPLAGTRVVLTRPKQRSQPMARRLWELGAEVLEQPTIAIRPVENPAALQEKLEELDRYQWLVFTSPTGVDVFFALCASLRFDLRRLSGIKLAVLGAGTANRLKERGLYPELMPERYSGEELGREMARVVKPGERILILRARLGSRELLQELESAGPAELADIPIYDTEEMAIGEQMKAELVKQPHTVTVFTSASTVRGYVHGMPEADFSKVNAVCIGEQTKREAERWNMKAFTAEQATPEALVEKILEWRQKEDRREMSFANIRTS